MALFETMRQNTKIILWITVAAFVGLIFLAWGADFATRSGPRPGEAGVLAVVNGERVSYREFADVLAQARAAYEMQTGQQPDESVELMLQANAWENLIDRTLLRQEARRLGITVSDREVAIALVNNPPAEFMMAEAFQTDGRFDIEKYRQFLVQSPDTRMLEAQHRELVAQDKIRLRVFSGVKVSEPEVHERWLAENERLDLTYAMVPYHKLLADVEPGDDDLRAYLRDHADQYDHPERVALDYIRIEKSASSEDSADARAEIDEALVSFRQGDDFLLLVEDYTQAPPDRRGGAAAAWLTRPQITPPAVAEAAFTLAPGAVSEVIAAADGYHVLRVEDRITEEGVDKVKLAEIFVPLKMSIETNMAIRDRLIDLADSIDVADFAEAAAAEGLALRNTGLFDREGFIPGLGRVEPAKQFAAQADANEISRPIEVGDAWYLLRVSQVAPAQSAQLEEVRARLRNDSLLERRKVEAQRRAEAILAQVRQGLALREASMIDSLAVFNTAEEVTRLGFIRGIGSDPAVTGAAFGQGAGLVPYAVAGSQGAFVLEVGGRETPSDSLYTAQRENIRQTLMRDKRNRVLTAWIDELRAEAEIEDFRLAISSM